MAIVISYPVGTTTLSTMLLGSQYDSETGVAITKNFSVGSISNLILVDGATGSFESNDAKLITVVNGLITGIEPIV